MFLSKHKELVEKGTFLGHLSPGRALGRSSIPEHSFPSKKLWDCVDSLSSEHKESVEETHTKKGAFRNHHSNEKVKNVVTE